MRNLSSFRKTENKEANLHSDHSKLPWKKITSPRTEECLGGNAAPEFDEDIVY